VNSIEGQALSTSDRTRVEILASILTVARRDALKTHIMYKANLSHKQLTKYLQFVIGNALLQEISDPEDGTRYYQVTEKGIQFLKDYDRLSSYME
jgi:predicted transcriptional regulator